MEKNSAELILDIIAEVADVPKSELRSDATFEKLGMDSLDFILLIQELRDRIGPITDEQAMKIESVGQLLEAFC
jgi:acyl carrier protein